MKFAIVKWEPKRKDSQYGFVSVLFDDYLQVDQIAIRDGKYGRWAALPSASWVGRDGQTRHVKIIGFEDKDVSRRFSDALVARLEEKYPEDFR